MAGALEEHRQLHRVGGGDDAQILAVIDGAGAHGVQGQHRSGGGQAQGHGQEGRRVQLHLLEMAAPAVAGTDEPLAAARHPLPQVGAQPGQAVPEEQEQLGRAVLRFGEAAAAALVHQMARPAPHPSEPRGDALDARLQVQGEQVGVLLAVHPPALQVVDP